jgi:hypothetical protein
MDRLKLATVPMLVAGGADADDSAVPRFAVDTAIGFEAAIAELIFFNAHS